MLTLCEPTGLFFLSIYHKSLIQSKVTFFKKKSGPEDQLKTIRVCVIKCVKNEACVKTQICVIRLSKI
jgi:hypothetical protein